MTNMQIASSVRKLVDDTLKAQPPPATLEEQMISEIWDNRVYAMATPTTDTAKQVNERFRQSYLIWNVSDEGLRTEVYQLLRRQICDVQWTAPGKSRMPCLEAAVKMCYSIKAWLELDRTNVAIVFCTNGKTRTGVLLACLLRFCGQVETSLEGFREFCRRRCQIGGEVVNKLPPTIVQFFRWFDDVMHTRAYPNRYALVLEKVRIQAVPVDDMPCIDVWDARNVKVYSSNTAKPSTTAWEDEQGVYREIKARLMGDFVVLCRFGGKYAYDEEDETKVLFRYVGHTAFLAEGPIELDKKKLDMMKRYAAVFEDDQFLLELDFKASADHGDVVVLPEHIHMDEAAAKEGLFEISRMHHVSPDTNMQLQLVEMGFTAAACTLALQLGDNDLDRAVQFLQLMKPLLQQGDSRGLSLLLNGHHEGPGGDVSGMSDGTKSISPMIEMTRSSPSRASLFFGLAGAPQAQGGGGGVRGRPQQLELPGSSPMEGTVTAAGQTVGGGRKRIVCVKCGNHDPLKRDQLFQCNGCNRAYHTNCVNLKQIPFKADEPSWAPYVRKTFAAWRCTTCQEGGGEMDGSASTPRALGSGSANWAATTFPVKSPGRTPQGLNIGFHGNHRLVSTPPPFMAVDSSGSLAAMSSTGSVSTSENSSPMASGGELGQGVGFSVRQLGELSDGAQSGASPPRPSGSRSGTATPLLEGGGGGAGQGDWQDKEISEMLKTLQQQGIYTTHQLKSVLQGQQGGGGMASPPYAPSPTSGAGPGLGPGKGPGLGGGGNNPKAALEAMFAARGGKPADGSADSEEPANPRASLMAALKKRTEGKDGGDAPAQEEKKAAADDPPPDPRANLMAMLNKQKGGGEPGSQPLPPAPPPPTQQAAAAAAGELIALGEHPKYGKYFKSLKAGAPRQAILNRMENEKAWPEVLDVKQDEMVPVDDAVGPKAVPYKDHPTYGKFFKQLKMGTPKEAVQHALRKEGHDESIIDNNPEAMAGAASGPGAKLPLYQHPVYGPYFMMLAFKVPVDAVKARMTKEGKDPAVLDKDPKELMPLQEEAAAPATPAGGDPPVDPPVAYKDHPKYVKYFRMLKMHMPQELVRHALAKDGLDEAIADKDPDAIVEEEMVVAKEHPKYAKYYKMLGMKIPLQAIKNKCIQEDLDPSFMDKYGPDDMAPVDYKAASAAPAARPKIPPKPKVRRKKLYWKEIPNDRLSKDSFWNEDGALELDLDFDRQEFEALFVSAGSPTNDKAKKAKATSDKKVTNITLLDGKRATNCAIAIARIKFEYEEIRTRLHALDEQAFTLEQLTSLCESLPTDDEVKTLKAYQGDVSRLGAAERFMMEMMKLPDASQRIEALKYMRQFHSRLSELRDDIKVFERACDDVKISLELKKLLKVVLTLGNHMNEGKQRGFTLDSLLKLHEAKAFDKKTSILHYLVQVIRKNDPSILDFNKGIQSVGPASKKSFELIQNELNELESGFTLVKKVASTVQRPAELPPLHRDGELATSPGQTSVLASSPPSKRQLGTISEDGDHDASTTMSPRTPVSHVSEGGGDAGSADGAKGANTVRQRQFSIFYFMDKTEKSLMDIRRDRERMESKFQDVLRYFGEDPQMSAASFFSTLEAFMKVFEQAKEDVAREEKRREREKRLAERKQQQQQQQAGGKPPDGAEGEARPALRGSIRKPLTPQPPRSVPLAADGGGGAKGSEGEEGKDDPSYKTPPRRRASHIR